MNKDEMIKEIRKDFVSPCIKGSDRCGKIDCHHCHATALYNANYRKIADDEIVIKQSKYEELRLAKYKAMEEAIEYEKIAYKQLVEQEEIAHSYEQGYAELLQSNHFLQDKLEQSKQEIVREILQEMKAKSRFNEHIFQTCASKLVSSEYIQGRHDNRNEWLKFLYELAKEHGIELE